MQIFRGEGVGGWRFFKGEWLGFFKRECGNFSKESWAGGGRFFKRRGEGVRKYFKGGGGRSSKERGGDFSKDSRGGIFQWRAGRFFKRELGGRKIFQRRRERFLKGSGIFQRTLEIFQREVGGGDFSKEGRREGHIRIRR